MGLSNLIRSGWLGMKNYPLFWVSSLFLSMGLMSLESPVLFGTYFNELFEHHFVFVLVLLISSFWLHFNEQFTVKKFSQWTTLFIIAGLADWIVYPFSELNYPASGGVTILLLLVIVMALGLIQLPTSLLPANKSLYQVVLQLIISTIYAQVIYIGIVLAIAGLKLLFDIDINEVIYFRLGVLCMLPLNAAILAGNLHELTREELLKIPHVLVKRLFQYVLIPLTILYVFITLSYLVKNIFGTTTDSLVVTWLSLGYLSFGLLTYSFGQLFEGDTDLSWWNTTKKRTLMVLMAIVWVGLVGGVFGRIGDYGYTINRYLLLLFGLWMGTTISMLLLKPSSFKNWIISLALFAFVGAVGPFSINNVPIKSQLERLEDILPTSTNETLQFNAANIDEGQKAELLDILTYITRDHGATKELSTFFGIERLPNQDRSRDRLDTLLTRTNLSFLRDETLTSTSLNDEVFIAGIQQYEQVGPKTHLIEWTELAKGEQDIILPINRDDEKSATLEIAKDLSRIRLIQKQQETIFLDEPFLSTFESDLIEHAKKVRKQNENEVYRLHLQSETISLDFNVSWVKLEGDQIKSITARVLVSWE